MKNDYSLLGILARLYKKRRFILLLTGTATLLAIILSLTMPNYYQASTLFYPASQDLLKPEKMFGTSNKEMEYYGNSDDIDRIITVASSNELADALIKKFNLYDVYEIDTSHPQAQFFVKKKLFKLYDVGKTKYDAMNIKVEDLVPDRSALMANYSLYVVDSIVTSMVRESQRGLRKALLQDQTLQLEELQLMRDSLSKLRTTFGIYDSESQSEALAGMLTSVESQLIGQKEKLRILKAKRGIPRDTINYLEARIAGLEAQLKLITSDTSSGMANLDKLNNGMGLITVMEKQFENISQQYSWNKIKLKQLETALNSENSAIHVVEPAQTPTRKSRPKRSIYVLAALIGSFVFSCLFVLLRESLKDVDWKKISEA